MTVTRSYLAAGVMLVLAACSTTNIYQLAGDGGSDPDADPHDAWVDAPGEDGGADTTLDAPADISFDTLESSDGDASSDGPVDAPADAIEEPWICDPPAAFPEGNQCAPEAVGSIGCGPDATAPFVPVVGYACEIVDGGPAQPSDAGRCRVWNTFKGAYFDASFYEFGCERWSCQRYVRFDNVCPNVGGVWGAAWACPYEPLDAGIGAPDGCVKSSTQWATSLGTGGPLYCCW